jgi:hypothetical protein
MSGELKFGRTVERWIRGATVNIPIMRMACATGVRWEPTGEVISAQNNWCDVEPGSFVAVVDLGMSSHLINVSTRYATGPQS